MPNPDVLPKPGPVGRGARLVLGAVLLLLTVLTLLSFRGYVRIGAPSGAWWLLAAASVYVLPQVMDIGFGRAWGVRSQAAAVLVAAAAVALDLILFRNLWGPPFGALLYGAGSAVLGFTGLSFVLAGLLAVPGCEFGAMRYAVARGSGGASELHR